MFKLKLVDHDPTIAEPGSDELINFNPLDVFGYDSEPSREALTAIHHRLVQITGMIHANHPYLFLYRLRDVTRPYCNLYGDWDQP